MLLSSSVIKNTKIVQNGNKEIITAGNMDIKKQSISDIEDILKQSGGEMFEGVDRIANTFIEDAKSTAENLRNRAIEESQDIEKKAFEKGFKEGFDKAYAETVEKGKVEVENFKSLAEQNASNLISSAKSNYEKYIIQQEEKIKKLAFSIASHVLNREVNNENGINEMIYDAVEESKNSELIIIKCSTLHYNSVTEAAAVWKRTLPVSGEIFVIEDNCLDDDKAIIEKNNGKIQVGIDIGIDKIKEEILRK
jgi:flagellar assembly protein FliH